MNIVRKEIEVDRELILAGAQKFYFQAMLAGSLGEKKKPGTRVSSLNNMTVTRIGNFSLLNRLWVRQDNGNFTGDIIILWWQDTRSQPIWSMTCSGQFPRQTLPFLRKVLIDTYKEEVFAGGRGLEKVEDQDQRFIYLNLIGFGGDKFNEFEGQEWISCFHNHERVIGSAKYSGRSLI